jgi:hypothetical protein
VTKAPRTCEWLDGERGAYVRCEAPACTGKSWCQPHWDRVRNPDAGPWRNHASRGGEQGGGLRDPSWLWATPGQKAPINGSGARVMASGYHHKNVLRMLGGASEIHTIPHGT